MADRTPVKATIVSGVVTGLAEYATGDTVPVANGGTGSTTATGTGSVVLASGPTLVAPKANAMQLGTSGTNSQNFVWSTGADGTMKLARGIVGTTTQDILTVDANGYVDVAPPPWVVTTPTPIPSAGGFGSASASLRIRKVGKTVFFNAIVDILSVGTASGSVSLALPHAAASTGALREWGGVGRESRNVGYMVPFWVSSGASTLILATAAGNVLATNNLLNVSGFYESAI